MDGILEIFTLGGVSIRLDGEPVAGMVTRKVEALLVYLACTSRPHPREVLAELLWEERSQTQSLSNLRVALSNLRKHLDQFVIITRATAGINPDADIWVDVYELEQQSKISRGEREVPGKKIIAHLTRSIELYKGDFLAGFPIRNCPGFENWMTLERERVRLVFDRCMADLLNRLILTNRWLDTIKWSEYWLGYGFHPELAYRSLMTAYCGLGDLASMSAVYQRCVTAFRDELGIDPSEQTRNLYQAFLQGERPTSIPLIPPTEPHQTSRSRSARLILDEGKGKECVDLASLAVIYTSRDDLDFIPGDMPLLIRSALHHGTDVQPWFNRCESTEDAVGVLRRFYQEYPKPKARQRVVEALKVLDHPESLQLLVRISASDDAPEIRAEAAVAAAARGREKEVASVLQEQLQDSEDTAALSAFVALVDEVGLPPGIDSYPKLPVWLGIARKRWQDGKGQFRERVLKGAVGGGLSLAFFGCLLPIFLYFGKPESFDINMQFVSMLAWILSGVIVGLVFGSLQGSALSFVVSLADILFQRVRLGWVRYVLGGFSGLVYTIYLITFSMAGLLHPETSANLYLGLFILYGVMMGMVFSIVIPPTNTKIPGKSMLFRWLLTFILGSIISFPVIFLVYPETNIFKYFQELCFIALFSAGMAIAMNRGKAV